MLDELRDRFVSFLSQNHVCVIATSGSLGGWAVSAQYTQSGLELNCRLPRWSDTLFHIKQEPRVMVIIQNTIPLRWMQYRGTASITDATADRYVTIHIVPEHIDLIDESRGWGSRETLDL